ncbi:MAG: hypothetical protein HQ574_04795 [Chloroflexi bacterium]|nr:hypothetical protein [Chloroflexota bacterium]
MSEFENNLICTYHPKRETRLRCNRCERPICIKCAKHTPTGYRCPECIRSQQKIFITTKWFDYIIAASITAVVAFVGSLLTLFLGFYTIFIALGAGYAAVWLVRKAIKNRRSPLLKIVISVTAFLGSLPPVIYWIITTLQEMKIYGYAISGGGFTLIWYLAYTVILTTNVFYQVRK